MTRIPPSLLFYVHLANTVGAFNQESLEVVAEKLARLRLRVSREPDA